jgi:hypothetical protein
MAPRTAAAKAATAPTPAAEVTPDQATETSAPETVSAEPQGEPGDFYGDAPAQSLTFPNLAGVVTKDLIQEIGTGKYAAAYVNWSRTQNLLHQHAPGWAVEAKEAVDGTILHKAPAGGYLLLRYVHPDGRVTPYAPQAVMDNRNAAIPYEKITARDITDTHRRGSCLVAALFFGLAYELWAKIEVGYGDDEAPSVTVPKAGTATAAGNAVTREDFLTAAIEKGLTTYAVEALEKKLNGNYSGGIAGLKTKDEAWVKDYNGQFAPKDEASQY